MEMMKSTSDLWMAHSRRSLTSLRRGDLCPWRTGEMRRTSICALFATDYAGVSEGVHNLIYRDYFELRVARKNLRRAIWRSKSRLWRELQEILDFVPWGISYRIIMNRLSSGFSLIVEALSTKVISDIVRVLFPRLSKEFQSILR